MTFLSEVMKYYTSLYYVYLTKDYGLSSNLISERLKIKQVSNFLFLSRYFILIEMTNHDLKQNYKDVESTHRISSIKLCIITDLQYLEMPTFPPSRNQVRIILDKNLTIFLALNIGLRDRSRIHPGQGSGVEFLMMQS